MSLESGTYISDLVKTNPTGTDPKSQGDDHLRLIKACVQQSFPNINAPVTAAPADLNSISSKVNKAGDTMTGQLNGISPAAAANLTRKDYVDSVAYGPAFLVVQTGSGQGAAPGGSVVLFTDAWIDTDAGWDGAGYSYRPPKAGIYQFNASVLLNNYPATEDAYISLHKNGNSVGRLAQSAGDNRVKGLGGSSMMAAVPGDYFQIFMVTTSQTVPVGGEGVQFSGLWIRP